MRLIGLAVVLALGLVLAPVAGEAQTAGTPRRIGVLYPSTRAADPRSDESLIGGLRALGWIEGRNLVVSGAGPRAEPINSRSWPTSSLRPGWK